MGPVVVISSNSMGVCHVFCFRFCWSFQNPLLWDVSLDFSRFIREKTQADVADKSP